MAQKITLKRSAVNDKVPLITDLDFGELAINTFDGHLFLKKNDGVDSIVNLNKPYFADIQTKPTTVSGYGITDGARLSANTFTGAQALTKVDKGSVGTGTVTFTVSAGNVQKLTVTGALTIALAGWIAGSTLSEVLIELVNGGVAVVTMPAAIKWILPTTGAAAASFSAYLTAIGRTPASLQSAGTDFLYLWSTDGGTTIYGKIM